MTIDGRSRNAKITIAGRQTGEGTFIDFGFPSGASRTFHLPAAHPLYDNFAAHGVGKKVRDQLANCTDEASGLVALDAQLAAFAEGKWNATRNGESHQGAGLLVQALSAKYGRTLDEAQAFVDKLSKKQQADLRAEPDVAKEIARVRVNVAKETSSEVKDLLSSFSS